MDKYRWFIIYSIIMLSVFTYNYGGQLEKHKGQGFKKLEENYIESLDSTIMTYEHLSSGAQVVYIKNSDPNKVFAMGFKTPIWDNTGVNHIVEHAVFTGSQKYNTKDVFFEMKKKSPSIYMNASTAADMTIYPFSTRNSKDYYNLLSVYLDAVFFPNLQKSPYGFQQEGWHYSMDLDENLNLNGVVYNEMKGASVVPRRILAMANRSVMYPDTMYIYNAGGNPDEIPTLTYETFKNTHKTFYVPSNSCAFIYGDVDINQILGTLGQYYNQFEKQESQDISQKQIAFDEIKNIKYAYPATDEDEGYFVSTNYVVGDMSDIKLQLSMEILMDILIEYEQSPLKRAFKHHQSSQTLSYDVDGLIPQPMYSIIATDVKKKDITKVDYLINQTLEKVLKEGFPPEIIKMAISQYTIKEKQRKHNVSKGIDMAYSCIYSWGHGVSPIEMIQRDNFMDEIKKEGDSLYFQNLLQKYIVENRHKGQVILEPSKDYIAKAQEKERSSIEVQSSSMSLEDKQMIMTNKQALEKWQKDNHHLLSLPKLKIQDLNQTGELPQLTIKENNLAMYYIANTSNLIYMDLYFDTSYIPQESLYDLFLYSYLVGEMEKDSVALYTGGLSTNILAIPRLDKYKSYDPKLKLSISMESENIDKTFEIINKITLKTKMWDEQWIQTQIQKIKVQYEDYFNSKPLDMVTAMVSSTEEGSERYEYEKILPFYQYISTLSMDYDQYKEKIISKLKLIDQSLFNKENIILGVTLGQEDIKSVDKAYKKYFKKLSTQAYSQAIYNFDKKQKRQGFPIASDVQYMVCGGNYKKLGGHYNGSLYVLGNILNSEYMLENIRVKNGAYGAGMKFNPYGNMMFYSYQDPKLKETLEIIQGAPKYIEQLDLEDEILDEHKIGALSKFEQQLGLNEHPKVIGETLQKYYLSGLNCEMIEKIRQEILEATMEDVKSHGPVIEKLVGEERYSIAGSKSRLLTNNNHFDIIQSFHKMYNSN